MPDNDTSDCDPVKGYLDLQRINHATAQRFAYEAIERARAAGLLHNNCRAGGEAALAVVFLSGDRVLLSPLPLTEALRYARKVLR